MTPVFAIVGAWALAAAGGGAAAQGPAELSAAAKADIMKAVCTGTLEKDAKGPVCRDAEEFSDERLTELRWLSAHHGRFVAGPDEWLVSLQGQCVKGCAGATFVVQHSGPGWKKLAETEGRIGDNCAVVSGLADGFDRIACADRASETGGGSLYWLDVRSLIAGKVSDERLMESAQGTECQDPDRAKDAELKGDRLEDVKETAAASDAAFTLVLHVRRRPCREAGTAGDDAAISKSRHLLTFVRRGSAVVPDDTSASIIHKFGWDGGSTEGH
jgi:hypothetical protein